MQCIEQGSIVLVVSDLRIENITINTFLTFVWVGSCSWEDDLAAFTFKIRNEARFS